jgi:ankyrin repeat protein
MTGRHMKSHSRAIGIKRGTAPGWVTLALGIAMFCSNPLSAQGLFESDPIFDYAKNRDVGAIDYLLKKGASVDIVDPSGLTILSIAAGNGDQPMIQLALENGARVDREDKIGRTALFWAVENGNPEVVEQLLNAGADINHQTRDGLTPVMAAVRSNRLAVLQLLLGEDPDLSVLDYTGRSALGWARASRDRRAERMLVRAGATD